jgi:hypothetical protein
MIKKLFVVLVFLTIPAVADSRLFREVRKKDTVSLVLPNGECAGRVVSRNLDQLTLRLEKKAADCGDRGSLITVSRGDVTDVVDNKLRDRGDLSFGPHCEILAMSLVGAPGAFAIGEKTGSSAAALSIFLGSAVAGAYLCRQRGPHFTIFAEGLSLLKP